MALHPAPTIELNLVLVQQPVAISGIDHRCLLTYACDNNTVMSVQDIADEVQTRFNANWASQFDNQVSVLPPSILIGDGSNVPAFAIGSGGNAAGLNAIDSPPPQVAALMKKVTALAGRRNRGRLYFPWIMARTAIGQDGELSGGNVTAYQSACDDWLGDLQAADLPMVIANKTLATDGEGKKFVTEIFKGAAVTQLIAESKVATQRRRLVRQ